MPHARFPQPDASDFSSSLRARSPQSPAATGTAAADSALFSPLSFDASVAMSHLDLLGNKGFAGEASPSFSWTPLLQAHSETAAKLWGAAAEPQYSIDGLHVDDLVFDSHSSSSESSYGANAPSASATFAPLPAWNSAGNLAALAGADSDDEDSPDAAWLKATSGRSLRRTRRAPAGMAGMQVSPPSPGAASLPGGSAAGLFEEATSPRALRSTISAPQLQRATTLPEPASTRSQLENLFEDVAWDATNEPVDTDQQQQNFSSSSNAGGAGGSSSSAAQGSLASAACAPQQGALFQRRAITHDGEMPQPAPVNTAPAQGSMSAPQMCQPLPYPGLQHSRSATFPLSHTWANLTPAQQDRVAQLQRVYTAQHTAARLGVYSDFVTPSQQFTGQESSERAARAVQAALLYGMEAHEPTTSPVGQRRNSSSGLSSAGLPTPITPMHPLAPGPGASPSFNYAPMFDDFAQSAGGAEVPFSYSTMTLGAPRNSISGAARRPSNGLGNALGLSALPAQQQHAVDASVYGHVFGNPSLAPIALQQQPMQRQQGIHKAPNSMNSLASLAPPSPPRSPQKQKSTPNLRSPPTGTPTIRKIASNRRLGASAAEPPMPEMPQQYASGSRARSSTTSSASGSKTARRRAAPEYAPEPENPRPGKISFVNYGIEDADELCAAVAPSGSYKIPLRGYGSGSPAADAGYEGSPVRDFGSQGMTASTSAARRSGPRWEDRRDGSVSLDASSPLGDESAQPRAVKRHKSSPNMATAMAAAATSGAPPMPSSPASAAARARTPKRKPSRAALAQ